MGCFKTVTMKLQGVEKKIIKTNHVKKSLDVVYLLELFSVKFQMNKMNFKGTFAVFHPDFFKLQ